MIFTTQILVTLLINFIKQESNTALIFYHETNSSQALLIELTASNCGLCAINVDNATNMDLISALPMYSQLIVLESLDDSQSNLSAPIRKLMDMRHKPMIFRFVRNLGCSPDPRLPDVIDEQSILFLVCVEERTPNTTDDKRQDKSNEKGDVSYLNTLQYEVSPSCQFDSSEPRQTSKHRIQFNSFTNYRLSNSWPELYLEQPNCRARCNASSQLSSVKDKHVRPWLSMCSKCARCVANMTEESQELADPSTNIVPKLVGALISLLLLVFASVCFGLEANPSAIMILILVILIGIATILYKFNVLLGFNPALEIALRICLSFVDVSLMVDLFRQESCNIGTKLVAFKKEWTKTSYVIMSVLSVAIIAYFTLTTNWQPKFDDPIVSKENKLRALSMLTVSFLAGSGINLIHILIASKDKPRTLKSLVIVVLKRIVPRGAMIFGGYLSARSMISCMDVPIDSLAEASFEILCSGLIATLCVYGKRYIERKDGRGREEASPDGGVELQQTAV